MQVADRLVPIAAIDEIVPIRDLVIYRAAVVAIGNAAIHAARRLVARGFLGKRDDELAVMANAIGGRRIAPVAPIDFEEARYLTHTVLSNQLARRRSALLPRIARWRARTPTRRSFRQHRSRQ